MTTTPLSEVSDSWEMIVAPGGQSGGPSRRMSGNGAGANNPNGSNPNLRSLSGSSSPLRFTNSFPSFGVGGAEDYMRMLREAARESDRRASPISSAFESPILSLNNTTRNSLSASPKSPPNSPNPELVAYGDELKNVYVNRLPEDVPPVGPVGPAAGTGSGAPGSGPGQPVQPSDVIWDWTSRPNKDRDWTLAESVRSRKTSSSASNASKKSDKKDEDNGGGFFSKRVFYTLIITNFLSFIIGAGIGVLMSKRQQPAACFIEIPI